MTDRRPARLVAAAIAIPLLAAAVLIPSAASAAAKPKPVKGQCTHLTGNAGISSGPGSPMLSGCSPAPNATGTASFTFTIGATTGSSTIHWPNGSVTHFTFTAKTTDPTKTKKVHGVSTQVPNPKFHCPASDLVMAALKGKIPKVGGNTGLPAGDTGLKGAVKATVCVTSGLGLSLVSGTIFAL